MFSIVSSYFHWLTKDAPQGKVERYPEVGDDFRTARPGIFIIGDLTGIPLLKLAAESGKKVWNSIREVSGSPEVYDAVIVGAGPSGLSAAWEGRKLGKKVIVLEAGLAFQTIRSYPKGKPIFAEPKSVKTDSTLQILDGTKEQLLDDLLKAREESQVQIQEFTRVSEIEEGKQSRFLVKTESGKVYACENVILSFGKSGDPRKLEVKGEDSPFVYHRLLDPADFQGQAVAIVGGGDSALEAAIALSKQGSRVSLIHRKSDFSRAKSTNQEMVQSLIRENKIEVMYQSKVRQILPGELWIEPESGSGSLRKKKVDSVLVLIGSLPPLGFLQKLKIPIAGEILLRHWLGLCSMLGFGTLAYFGKASFYGNFWYSYLASAGAVISIITGIMWSSLLVREKGFLIPTGWALFRNLYLTFAFIFFAIVYFLGAYGEVFLWDKKPSFHYTFLYSLTILIFGIRRIYLRPTQYIRLQTFTLISIQILPLFLLPELILPYLGKNGFLGSPEGFVFTQLFPGEAYWNAYRFILAWPLNIGALYDSNLTPFWLGYGLFLSFAVIPFLVFRYGKGAYCGWICSCGGLAETLGDEHRTKMPHSGFAYKIEHSGQWILLLAIVLTVMKLFGLGVISDSVKWIYDLGIDVLLAGVIGVGCYFLFSGRVWCRMFCPLAGLMHIYARFSQFRIFSEKKKCISCNVCTKVCHQGIDVMSYANIGRPMDSVQCVRCSACVSQCPTGVLSFGRETSNGVVKDSISAVLS